MPGCSDCTCMLVCVFLCIFAHETAGAASTRRSLRPQKGGRIFNGSGALRGEGVESYLCTVIASEAKQSISQGKERMDCFASLAMTNSLKIESEYLRRGLLQLWRRATPFAQQKCRRSLAGICVWAMVLAQLFFTSEQTLFSSGMKASSAGMVATRL
jgi:hypothetical protein